MSARPRIRVVSNPRSRQNLKDKALAGQLRDELGDYGISEEPLNRDALGEMARRFHDDGVDVVCLNGGDGTVHTVLTAMIGAYGSTPLPPIALLCGGTMNTIAKTLGVSGRPRQLLRRIVDQHKQGKPFTTKTRYLMKIDGQRYGFLWGNGVFSNYLELFYEGGEPTPAKAAAVLGRGVASALFGGTTIERIMRPFVGQALFDGQPLEGDRFVSVAAGTVEQVGLGFSPFSGSVKVPGKIHAVALRSGSLGVVRELPRVWMARPLGEAENTDALVARIELIAPGRIPYMLDGDLYEGADRLVVEIGPSVEMVVP